jgi:Spy/CpxP family protein refolding chaperone
MKIKTSRIAPIIIILAVIFLAVTTAEARRGRMGGPRGGGHMGLKTMMALNLTPEQQTAVSGIIDTYDTERGETRDRLEAAREGIATVMQSEAFDESALRKAFQEASTAREDLFVLGAKMREEIKKVLTPDQIDLLKEKRAERRKRMESRMARKMDRLDQ